MLVEAARLDRSAVYEGALLVFRRVPAMLALSELADRFVREAGADPTSAMNDSDANEAICRRFEADESAQGLMIEAMAHVGVDVGTEGAAFVDRLRLRIQPSRPAATVDAIDDARFATGRFSETLPVHRDTWASNIAAQINMWGPMAPISAERTMRIFPSFLATPVPNTSAEWDFRELRAAARAAAAAADSTSSGSDAASGYPQMPVFAPPDAESAAAWERRLHRDAFPVVIAPGDLLAFSGAHLHGSVPNATGIARLSAEWRTVDQGDLRRSPLPHTTSPPLPPPPPSSSLGREGAGDLERAEGFGGGEDGARSFGAVNCDGRAPRTEEPMRWFGHTSDPKRKLSRGGA